MASPLHFKPLAKNQFKQRTNHQMQLAIVEKYKIINRIVQVSLLLFAHMFLNHRLIYLSIAVLTSFGSFLTDVQEFFLPFLSGLSHASFLIE